eukprot:CAMPEP_0201488340 /NCGR_PEP_ID=MMETSP0151_2-20130828/17894_1 /ASSEMBLY_ACC=CAM_ASM_000257 /TAXON_ID=200890 /ORGANISM="Paramoeba atlantica, Strain 621/1 / CCAP 1560/9" /LENGTH=1351 /DNA_ID=CAMNT_0047873605 /DNA_START=76 /DNA_END=4131 /DNA_ORIENTATION=+
MASIFSGLRKAGGDPYVPAGVQDVETATHVILPGVGAFGSSIQLLRKTPGLEAALKKRILEERPTLCVCIGLQLLATSSDETLGVEGLGLIPVHVSTLPSDVVVPQQGWNKVTLDRDCKLLQEGYAYYSNTYCLKSVPLGWRAAISQHGAPFVAALEKGAVVATQFHPELSGQYGSSLIKRWLATSDTRHLPEVAAQKAFHFRSSNLTRRIIPCLDVRDGRVVKGVKFQNLTDAGDPALQAKAYEEQGADELTMLDVSATPEGRNTAVTTVKAIRECISLPLTVGGGISSLADAQRLLDAGADKVSINTAAVKNPDLIRELSTHFGSQCIVLAIDAMRDGESWRVVVRSGKEKTERDAIEWGVEGVQRGAGEILLTSMDRDGTRAGYDIELLRKMAERVSVPVIASGGASSSDHMAAALREGYASATLAASIFHYGDYTVQKVKDELLDKKFSIRPMEPATILSGFPESTNKPLQCLVPSVDIMNGSCVQLVGGKPEELKIDAGDPLPIAKRFSICGEMAVVDLDAAMNRGSNREIIKKILPFAKCRVGGGIRTVESALDWLNAGAASVVIGTAASPEFLAQLPRDRVVVALDAVHGEVVVDGWKTKTGRGVEERIAELAPYASRFLVTFVEREGRMQGIDVKAVQDLVNSANRFNAQITVAGGVTTERDITILDSLGVEAQVGMALYSGRLSLGSGLAAPLRSDRPDQLFPTVVCDEHKKVLGLVYSSRESIKEAVDSQKGVYHSRTRGIWRKGETSGNHQELLEIILDCDRDSLCFVVKQLGKGEFCHRSGFRSCFGLDSGLAKLMSTIISRSEAAPEGSYTKRLFDEPGLLDAKIREEANELAEAQGKEHVSEEAADLFYFALTACYRAKASLRDVEKVLDRRALKVIRRKGDAKKEFLKSSEPSPTPSPSPSPSLASEEEDVKLKQVTYLELIEGQRRDPVDDKAVVIAKEILEDVKIRREAAVLHHAKRFGDIKEGEKCYYFPEDLEKAFLGLPKEVQSMLRRTAQRIESFAESQKSSFVEMKTTIEGGNAGHSLAAVDVAGCYAPAGRYPLPSTVLMTAITARVAGCKQVWVASPHPVDVILGAAYIARVDGLLAVGGVQAIGAMAYGSGPVPPADAIVGPGNKFVTAAKSLIAGKVRIDMLAGPSECLVLADDSADPSLVAADLLAQAEHDVEASAILVSLSESFIPKLEHELNNQLRKLPTADTARKSLQRNGMVLLAKDQKMAVQICDFLAPEHLEIHCEEVEEWSKRLSHYGGLFCGSYAAEVFGDYGAGPNHTLPTGGSARSFGGLSFLTFTRVRTWMRIDDLSKAEQMMADAVMLAGLEGLHGHKRAAELRLQKIGNSK